MLRYFVMWVIGGLSFGFSHNSLTAQRLNYLFSPSLRNRITNILMSGGNTKKILINVNPLRCSNRHSRAGGNPVSVRVALD